MVSDDHDFSCAVYILFYDASPTWRDCDLISLPLLFEIGIWDCMSSQEVITFVRKGISEQVPLDTLCEKTMDHCLASDSGMTGVGCDNMTMLIVAFLNGKTLEEWYEHITKRVAVRLGPADSKVRPNGDEDPETLNETTAEKAADATSTETEEVKEAKEPNVVETAEVDKKEEQKSEQISV